ncbi:4-oxalocrotonate tautomerase [Paraburkholderia sp. BCC1886]|uniref:tautomerase family protein n=1 Tax=Paraburkholderia sp. BCC1886 TaxID=2562670 RepID=UPI0028CB8565|nr:4-oxalocrotonate tautomerase [Paraburkholderia sp. BCC1886]
MPRYAFHFDGKITMPGINLTVSGIGDAGQSERLAIAVSTLTCTVLQKELGKTMVIVRYVPHEQWFIAGQSLASLGKNSFRLEVTITEETNTKSQKADYHRQAFELLSTLVGNVHPHSNVHIIDCAATGYGYGGLTQEYRYHRAA